MTFGSGTYGDGTYGQGGVLPAWIHHPTRASFGGHGDVAAINPSVPNLAAIHPSVPTSAEVKAHELRAIVGGHGAIATVAPGAVRADVQDVETLAEVA